MTLASFTPVLREQVIFITVSFMVFFGGPGIVYAQESELNPVPFTETLRLSRGSLEPGAENSVYLLHDDYCRIALTDWGWDSCEGVDQMIIGHVPGVDTTIIEKPNSEGLVSFDDWDSGDRDKEIAQIEASLKDALKQQGQKIGQEILFKGWHVYPTLDVEKKYLLYATDISWQGDIATNIKVSKFDRRGYVTFSIVPDSANATESEIRAMVEATLTKYEPSKDQSYTSFVSGDTVAATGAIGVLATLVGVKYGKAAVGGLIAVALLVLKKVAFLVLLPIAWIGKRFKGRKSKDS